jgi:hypothetical protein
LFVRHDEPVAHPCPQTPPQPSLPHSFSVQFGTQHLASKHFALPVQTTSAGHDTQSSLESATPLPQSTSATQVPLSQRAIEPHACPHLPPQPSSPQVLPSQLGTQHIPMLQPELQVQSLGHDSQFSPGSQVPFPQNACP